MPARWFVCTDGERIRIQVYLRENECRMSERCATRPYPELVSNERKWAGKPSTTLLVNGTMLSFIRISRSYAISPDNPCYVQEWQRPKDDVVRANFCIAGTGGRGKPEVCVGGGGSRKARLTAGKLNVRARARGIGRNLSFECIRPT